MLFGRGAWAIFGIEPSSLKKFETTLTTPKKMFELSQLAASITTKFEAKPTIGINPFASPRMDEDLKEDRDLNDINDYLNSSEEEKKTAGFNFSKYGDFFGMGTDFALGNNAFGFWVVFNEYEDVTHIASRKEAASYKTAVRPFKFLGKEEKKVIEQSLTASATITRLQFPVVVDIQHGRVYAATSNVEQIGVVRELLGDLGAKAHSLRWDFQGYDWTSKLLNAINSKTKFRTEMKQRAEELSRLRPEDIEKLEDKNLEKIVSTFFALSEMESELWLGLSTPARIKMFVASDPVTTANPSVAFGLLGMTDSAEVASASMVVQELTTTFNKKGEEKQVRKDLFTLDINDKINLQDAGAAMLRGFDLPQFKREMKQTLKANGSLTIKDFWSVWLAGIHEAILTFSDNVTTLLELDKKKYGLMTFEDEAPEEEAANA
jgi:hypothetical protein